MKTSVSVDTTDYSKNDSDYKFSLNTTNQLNKGYKQVTFDSSLDSKSYWTLVIFKNEKIVDQINFTTDTLSSISSEVVKFNEFVAIGFSHYFYLYDLRFKTIITFINLKNFFASFKIYNQQLFVIYDSGIYCLDNSGTVKWLNKSLGPAGVYIEEFKNDRIIGNGKYSQPDEYRNFVIDINTGKNLE